MVANSPHYSPYYKSSCPSDHNVIIFFAPPISWCSKWHDHDVTIVGHICPSSLLPGRDIYVLPVPYQGWTYMSFQSLTREGHICPSSLLPGRDIYVLPVPYQGWTYVSFQSLTREGHTYPSSPLPGRDIYVLPVQQGLKIHKYSCQSNIFCTPSSRLTKSISWKLLFN